MSGPAKLACLVVLGMILAWAVLAGGWVPESPIPGAGGAAGRPQSADQIAEQGEHSTAYGTRSEVPTSRPSEAPDRRPANLQIQEKHLSIAEAALQAEARDALLRIVAGNGEQISQVSKRPFSWQNVLQLADLAFSKRQAEVCAELLAKGEGLLVLGGEDYSKKIRGKKFQMVSVVGRELGRTRCVLVVVDPPDPELERLEREHWNVRAAMLSELLVPFLNLPIETRAARIREFLEAKSKGKATGALFGVSDEHLDCLEIDRANWMVVPIFR